MSLLDQDFKFDPLAGATESVHQSHIVTMKIKVGRGRQVVTGVEGTVL